MKCSCTTGCFIQRSASAQPAVGLFRHTRTNPRSSSTVFFALKWNSERLAPPLMSHQSRTTQKMRTQTTVRIKSPGVTVSGRRFDRELVATDRQFAQVSMQQISWFDATLKRDADYFCQSGSCFVSSRTRIMKCACFHCEFVASAHLKLCPCVAGTASMFREHSMTHIRHSKTGHLNQLHPLAPRASICINVVPWLMLLPGRGSTIQFQYMKMLYKCGKAGRETGTCTPDTSQKSMEINVRLQSTMTNSQTVLKDL